MNKIILCSSMMCADYGNLKNEVESLDAAGVDSFHCDVMDGTFVPNMTMGINDIKTIRKYTNKMIDVHLMVENPSTKIQWFIDAGADLIYIHQESECYVIKTFMQLKEAGVKAGLVISPDTSIETIEELLNLADYVMVMTVSPGFAGQKYLDFVTAKIVKLVKLKEKYNYKIVVDGACSPSKIDELSKLGVEGFVLGTSALFGKKESYSELLAELRK